jgi:hypothetical protein
MFRVFVTNPDLLRLVRPRTFRELTAARLKPVFADTWRDRLQGAPARTLAAAEKHIDRARVQTSASAPAAADLFKGLSHRCHTPAAASSSKPSKASRA